MTNITRALLDSAKAFRQAKIATCSARISEIQCELQQLQQESVRWAQIIPADIFPLIREAEEEKSRILLEVQETAKLHKMRRYSLDEAYLNRRAILPPEAEGDKSMRASMLGLLIGGMLGMYIAWFHLSVHSELLLMLAALIGSGLGLLSAIHLFVANFVVDESLEISAAWRRTQIVHFPRAQLRATELNATFNPSGAP